MNREDRYAELAVRVGANVQPGQLVDVLARIEHATVARAVTRAAYKAGARYVDVYYSDQHIRRALIEGAADELLSWTPPWLLKRSVQVGDERAAVRGEAHALTGVAERAAVRLHELRVGTLLASMRGIGVASIGGGRASSGHKCDQCCPSRYPRESSFHLTHLCVILAPAPAPWVRCPEACRTVSRLSPTGKRLTQRSRCFGPLLAHVRETVLASSLLLLEGQHHPALDQVLELGHRRQAIPRLRIWPGAERGFQVRPGSALSRHEAPFLARGGWITQQTLPLNWAAPLFGDFGTRW
jgi:hypothetical protein